jgi:cyanophycinase-like exopeptidase
MRGAVAVIADAELDRGLETLARELLGAVGPRRPRVVVVSVPDDRELRGGRASAGESAAAAAGPAAAAAAAYEQFGRVGADVESIAIGTIADADDVRRAQAVGEAELIWLTAGRSRDVLERLRGTLVWAAVRLAHERGAIVAGCAAGGSALSARTLEVRPRLGLPVHWRHGLGLIEAASIVPGYDDRPETLRALMAFSAPRGVAVVGLDRGTALVGRDDAWQVYGAGRVTVWRGRRRERHRAGDVIRLRGGGQNPASE